MEHHRLGHRFLALIRCSIFSCSLDSSMYDIETDNSYKSFVSNSHVFLVDEVQFTGGKLLGSFRGPAYTKKVTPVEAVSNERSPQGYYVILQKDSTGLEGDNQQFHVAEFVAFGRYDAQAEGYAYCVYMFISV